MDKYNLYLRTNYDVGPCYCTFGIEEDFGSSLR